MTEKEAYDKGYRDALTDKWIPVEERIPEDYVKVLLCGRKGGIYVAFRFSNFWWNTKNVIVTNPQAWMPLPAPWEGEK